MSGGHWNYLSRQIEDSVENQTIPTSCTLLMAAIEHELDWGHSCDTCLACARRRVIAGIEVFFDSYARGHRDAVSVMTDHHRVDLMCDRCLARVPSWSGPKVTDRFKAEAAAELAERTTDA